MEHGDAGIKPEVQNAPEREFRAPSPEFSRRVLVGPKNPDVLNPNRKDVPSPSKEDLGNFQDRDYTLFTNKSLEERRAYWETKGEGRTFDEQKTSWTDSLQETFAKNHE